MMDWNDLRSRWRATEQLSSMLQMLGQIHTRSDKLRGAVRRRDFIETAIAILIFPAFAWLAWQLGSRVRGHYLGQPFDAKVLGVQALTAQPGHYRLTLHFDEPVDVVTFESFSAFRQRVNCTVDETGRTAAKTSNGRPHLELEW